jgi:hypothetical protein
VDVMGIAKQRTFVGSALAGMALDLASLFIAPLEAQA